MSSDLLVRNQSKQAVVYRHKILELRMLFIFFILFSMLTWNTLATTLKKLSLEELVSHADEIVAGTCEKTETIWLDKKIYTVATIRVNDSAKGVAKKDDTIEVYELGGRVKEPIPVKMYVPGAASFEKGEEMVLFLEKRGDKQQYRRLVGMAQGKIPISTDPKTGEKMVHYAQPIKGVKWVDQEGKSVEPEVSGARPELAKEGSLEGSLGRIKQIDQGKGTTGHLTLDNLSQGKEVDGK